MRLDCRRESVYVTTIGKNYMPNQLYRKGFEMNLSDFPPFDESVQGRALTPATISQESRSGALFGADLVQSNMQTEWSSGTPDIAAIKRSAEAMRNAYILSLLQAAFAALENWFARLQQQELEDYLADSQNLADLESRMRRYAARRTAFDLTMPHFD
jgi:hypothetical protein